MPERHIDIRLLPSDAEPILRQAAHDAAKFGAFADFITPNTVKTPARNGMSTTRAQRQAWFREDRAEWQAAFLRAKRIVEAFGVDYEPTSEQETMTFYFPHVGGTTRKGAMGFSITEGSRPDYDDPLPQYSSGVHAEACRQAADRVVRAWRASLEA